MLSKSKIVASSLSNSLDVYINVIHKIPLLTTKEERIFFLKLQKENDIVAIHFLVISHLRYVVKIAKNYVSYGFLLSDLIQEGTIGLLKSIKRYEIRRNTRLISFAVYWIKSEIHEYILTNLRIVKFLTTNLEKNLFFKLKNYKKNYEKLTLCEIKQFSFNFRVCEKIVTSVDDKIYTSNGDYNLRLFDMGCNNFFLKHEFFETDFMCNYKNNSKILLNYLFIEVIEKLDFKKKYIFIQRWFTKNKCSFKNIALLYNLSSERIRQIEFQILYKIRKLCKFFVNVI